MARSCFIIIGAFLVVLVVPAVAAGQQIVLGQGSDGPVAVAGCSGTPGVPDPTIAVGPEHIVATGNASTT